MPGHTSHYSIAFAEATDEVKAFPGEVSEPGAKTLDEKLYELVNHLIETGKLTVTESLVVPAGFGGHAAKSIIATEQSRENVAYGLLATPDEVTVTIPASGLIVMTFSALWASSVASAGRAAIFVGANQFTVPDLSQPAPAFQEAPSAVATEMTPLVSSPTGLLAGSGGAVGAHTEVTTGQAGGLSASTEGRFRQYVGGKLVNAIAEAGTYVATGGQLLIDNLPAGTYTISVQFKATAGKVSVKNRRLRAWVVA
jgi:hypothetical protein